MNGSKNALYMIWSIAIVLCIFLVLFALLFSTFSSARRESGQPSAPVEAVETPAVDPNATPDPNATADPNATPDPNATADPNATPAVAVELGQTEDAGDSYIDSLTFLGDSTTYGLKYYKLLSGGEDTKQVWTPASGTLALFNQSTATIVYPVTGEEVPIATAAGMAKPAYLVITLGVNGVSSMKEDYFKEEYTKLIESVKAASPDTKIICNSIYPVTTAYAQKGNGIDNATIQKANGWLMDIAESTGTRFVNSASAVTGADGGLIPELCNDEGLHLNDAGFKKILEYLRTHAYQ